MATIVYPSLEFVTLGDGFIGNTPGGPPSGPARPKLRHFAACFCNPSPRPVRGGQIPLSDLATSSLPHPYPQQRDPTQHCSEPLGQTYFRQQHPVNRACFTSRPNVVTSNPSTLGHKQKLRTWPGYPQSNGKLERWHKWLKVRVLLVGSQGRRGASDSDRYNILRVQCDEVWAFCYAKAKNVPEVKKGCWSGGRVDMDRD